MVQCVYIIDIMPYVNPIKKREYYRNWMKKDRKLHPEKHKLSASKWRLKNKEYINKKRASWRKEQPKSYWAKENERVKAKRKIVRKEVIQAYGNKCTCCGEKQYDFLTIEHKNNNGAAHRKIITATRLPFLLKKLNFPSDYEVLCYNCNCAKAFNETKICPHQD